MVVAALGAESRASNFGRAMTEMACMRALLRARDTEFDDDNKPDDDAGSDDECQPTPKPVLGLRCFPCAGRGELWVTDENYPSGRSVRCVVCNGTGRVDIMKKR